MKKSFKFKYPKTVLLIACIILAYIIFRNPIVGDFFSGLGNFGYFADFIAGVFIAFGFTAPFAVGFFITSHPSNIFYVAIIGGVGAALSDVLILRLIRFSLMNEFIMLEHTELIRDIGRLIKKEFGNKIKNYIAYIFAGFLIASPLPDEIGIAMLAGFTKIRSRFLAKISFVLHTAEILMILWIAT